MSSFDNLPSLLTEAEVASALRVTTRTVRRWDGEHIRAVRVGGVKRYRTRDIAALIEPTTSEATGAQSDGFAKTGLAGPTRAT